MVRLTRLNGRPFVLNAELIQYVEATPDTVVTLVNGEKVIVREDVDGVIDRVLDYRRGLRLQPET